jgi:hemerythrin-like domain-containing protein
MNAELGKAVIEAPLSGMLVEHDLGRLFIRSLEAALERVKRGDEDSKVDIIANAIGYTDLLNRHIDKEDNVIYTFAKKSLSKEALDDVDKKCNDVENTANANNLQKKYTDIIEELENKWK